MYRENKFVVYSLVAWGACCVYSLRLDHRPASLMGTGALRQATLRRLPNTSWLLFKLVLGQGGEKEKQQQSHLLRERQGVEGCVDQTSTWKLEVVLFMCVPVIEQRASGLVVSAFTC